MKNCPKCGYADGAEVKGVHKSAVSDSSTDPKWMQGQSKAGEYVEGEEPEKAKAEHKKVLGEMKGMRGQNRQNFAEGDIVDPSADPTYQNDTEQTQPDSDEEDAAEEVQPETPAAAAPATTPAAAAPTPASDDNTIPVIGQKSDLAPPKPPSPMTAQEMNEAHMSFEQDRAQSKIDPKTYQDLLWNDKSVPGKIGSLFGLMLSGMGSGLTHQPNLLMEMMNNTIQRDTDAQKATMEGARNLYQLHMQHLNSQSEQQANYYKSALDYATAGLKPAEKARIIADTGQAEAMTRRANAETSTAMLNNKKLSWILDQLNGHTVNMPPAQQSNAIGTINNAIAPAVQSQIQKNNQEAAAKAQLIQGIAPYPQVPSTKVEDDQKLNALSMLSETAPQATAAKEEAKQSNYIGNMIGDYHRAFGNINTENAGQDREKLAIALDTLGPMAGKVIAGATAIISPEAAIAEALGSHATDPAMRGAADIVRKTQQWRMAQIGPLDAEISRLSTGQYSPGESAETADSRWPTLYDMASEDPDAVRKAKHDNTIKLLADKADNTPTLNGIRGARTAYAYRPQYEPMNKKAGSRKNSKEASPENRPSGTSSAPMVDMSQPLIPGLFEGRLP